MLVAFFLLLRDGKKLPKLKMVLGPKPGKVSSPSAVVPRIFQTISINSDQVQFRLALSQVDLFWKLQETTCVSAYGSNKKVLGLLPCSFYLTRLEAVNLENASDRVCVLSYRLSKFLAFCLVRFAVRYILHNENCFLVCYRCT